MRVETDDGGGKVHGTAERRTGEAAGAGDVAPGEAFGALLALLAGARSEVAPVGGDAQAGAGRGERELEGALPARGPVAAGAGFTREIPRGVPQGAAAEAVAEAAPQPSAPQSIPGATPAEVRRPNVPLVEALPATESGGERAPRSDAAASHRAAPAGLRALLRGAVLGATAGATRSVPQEAGARALPGSEPRDAAPKRRAAPPSAGPGSAADAVAVPEGTPTRGALPAGARATGHGGRHGALATPLETAAHLASADAPRAVELETSQPDARVDARTENGARAPRAEAREVLQDTSTEPRVSTAAAAEDDTPNSTPGAGRTPSGSSDAGSTDATPEPRLDVTTGSEAATPRTPADGTRTAAPRPAPEPAAWLAVPEPGERGRPAPSRAIRFDVEPEDLGRIEVRLALGRDGLRATMVAEQEHARALLAGQKAALAAALERNDLRLASLLVGLSGGEEGARRDAPEESEADAEPVAPLRGARVGGTSEDETPRAAVSDGLVSVHA